MIYPHFMFHVRPATAERSAHVFCYAPGRDVPDVPDDFGPNDGFILMTKAELDAAMATISAPVPQSVTRRQLFLWLNGALGITRAQIRAQLTTESALIEFDEAPEIHRDHPLVTQLGAAIALTAEQIDDGFRAAANL